MTDKKFWQKRKIFLSITTTRNSNWREKIKEAKKLGLREVCLFLTCLIKKEREEFYKLLEKTKIKRIPLVHLRSDMKIEELDYLVENYKTEIFNIHSEAEYPLEYDLEKYIGFIYIENAGIKKTGRCFNEEEVKRFAGICLDISHLENEKKVYSDIYESNLKIIEKYPCGCNHISAVKRKPFKDQYEPKRYDSHSFDDLSEFDYLKKYPARYFSKIIALELENSLKEQLAARDYIMNLLKDKK